MSGDCVSLSDVENAQPAHILRNRFTGSAIALGLAVVGIAETLCDALSYKKSAHGRRKMKWLRDIDEPNIGCL